MTAKTSGTNNHIDEYKHYGGTRPKGWGALALGNICIRDKKEWCQIQSKLATTRLFGFSYINKIFYKYLYNSSANRYR